MVPEKIACHVTVRGEKAEEILEKGLKVRSFDFACEVSRRVRGFGFALAGRGFAPCPWDRRFHSVVPGPGVFLRFAPSLFGLFSNWLVK